MTTVALEVSLALTTVWTRLHPDDATIPVRRLGHALVHDVARDRVVLFGGNLPDGPGGALVYGNDTWEWDGVSGTWIERTPATRPPARREHAMVFHAAAARVVLFGGAGSPNATAEADDRTWLFDGTDWTAAPMAASDPRPVARTAHAMASGVLDGEDVVTLFGGLSAASWTGGLATLDDTWTWDGARWVQAGTPPFSSPPDRYGHVIAYDPAQLEVVLFGGRSFDGAYGDTWRWDGSTWTRATPAASPPARHYAAMAVDPLERVMWLVGGLDGGFGYLGDSWMWDGAAWSKVEDFVWKPPVRAYSALAFDPARRRMILFGGANSHGSRNDTWELDRARGTWWDLDPRGIRPRARALVTDEARGSVLDIGWTETVATWEWRGRERTWTPLFPVGEDPGRRIGHALAYDSAHHRVVLFGGTDNAGTLRGETWEWNGAAATWASSTPVQGPAARREHAMAFHAGRRRTVLYGGTGCAGCEEETWEWDGAAWSSFDGEHPPPRRGHAMAYDGHRVVLFSGGEDHTFYAADDTWAWDGAWRLVPPLGLQPPARRHHAMAYDPARRAIVMFGGVDGVSAQYLSDTWLWDGAVEGWSEWMPAEGQPVPRARSSHSLAFDPSEGHVLLFGGDDSRVLTDDTWSFVPSDRVTNFPPRIEPIDDRVGIETEPADFVVVSSDRDGDAVTLSAEGLPPGAGLAQDGAFSWTPGCDQAGVYPLVFHATDGHASTFEDVTLTIAAINCPPSIEPIGDRTGVAGIAWAIALSVHDPDGDAVELSLEEAPAGARLDGDVVRWVPGEEQVGEHALTVLAFDGELSRTERATLRVERDPGPPASGGASARAPDAGCGCGAAGGASAGWAVALIVAARRRAPRGRPSFRVGVRVNLARACSPPP